ncbi:MAG: ABC transporter ATP-binding protein [Firmicutes bacterium]|jgi:peptide/nickel transport system ATP-binding protein|nr:ABC transporter ATP-binding protein [Bacillota bacterium]
MADKLLEINDLEVIYTTEEGGIVNAVNGLDLTVNEGETLGLVGETGAGKTTVALSIMKLLPERVSRITKGQIFLGGIDVTNATEADMRVMRGAAMSMIFQDPMTSLNPVQTIGNQIAEMVELHNRDYNKKQISDRVDELLKLVGLPADRKGEYPHQFSGGMRQRVVIAISLACEPKLLLADEPTTALDVTIQAQVLDLMNKLKEQFNTAMILITHDLGVVAQTCDRVAIMYAGEIVEIGTVADIFEGRSHHPYTEGLFGSIPNLEKPTRRLQVIEGLMPDPTNLPEGCKFHPRCPECMEICKAVYPEVTIIEGEHRVKCHLFYNGDHS